MSDPLRRTTGVARLTSADIPFILESDESIAPLIVAYETCGRLADDRSNVILVCHALTGSAHAAGVNDDGMKGWWDDLIGPGKGIDTDRWFVVCSNVIGGCYGSTGPRSFDPRTGARYGRSFPTVTVRDMVRAQRLLLSHLGIERLHAVIGGSMGGMQVLEWGLLYPDSVGLLIPIATSAGHSAWCVGFNAIAREAVELGRLGGDESAGLRLARKVAMMTYRSDLEFAARFGRDGGGDALERVGSFAVESYLEHHGRRLVERFDAATYETITRAMDLHDVTRGRGPLAETLGSITQPTLCVGITSDVLYPVHEQREIASLIPNARYREIDSLHGHDAFLIELGQLGRVVREFLDDHPVARSRPVFQRAVEILEHN